MNKGALAFNTLTFDEVQPQTALVKLNRPETLNAMNMEMLDDFKKLFEILSADDSIRVLILTGNGRGFSSGADLNDAVTHSNSEAFSDPETFLKLVQEKYSALITGLSGIPQPVIADAYPQARKKAVRPLRQRRAAAHRRRGPWRCRGRRCRVQVMTGSRA